MPAGILAGILLGAAHLSLFHRGVGIACAIGRPTAAKAAVFFLGAMRFLMTASAGYALVSSGISAMGLGIGLLVALYVYRVGLVLLGGKSGQVIAVPEEGRV